MRLAIRLAQSNRCTQRMSAKEYDETPDYDRDRIVHKYARRVRRRRQPRFADRDSNRGQLGNAKRGAFAQRDISCVGHFHGRGPHPDAIRSHLDGHRAGIVDADRTAVVDTDRSGVVDADRSAFIDFHRSAVVDTDGSAGHADRRRIVHGYVRCLLHADPADVDHADRNAD